MVPHEKKLTLGEAEQRLLEMSELLKSPGWKLMDAQLASEQEVFLRAACAEPDPLKAKVDLARYERTKLIREFPMAYGQRLQHIIEKLTPTKE